MNSAVLSLSSSLSSESFIVFGFDAFTPATTFAIVPHEFPHEYPHELPHAEAIYTGPHGSTSVPVPSTVRSFTFLMFDAIGDDAAALNTAVAISVLS